MRLVVEWRLADPGLVGGDLAELLGLPRPDLDAEALAIPLVGGVVRLVRSPAGHAERLTVAVDRSVGGPGPVAAEVARLRLLGVGWATVELDRGTRALEAELGLPPGAFAPAADDGWLGARCHVARLGGGGASPSAILLEPSTEGRLAAALARHGEGPVALWLLRPGVATAAVRPGPLGPARLIHGPAPWGPFVLLASDGPAAPVSGPSGAGTIAR